MRKLIMVFACALALFAVKPASAQTMVESVDPYRVMAISAGAVGGVIIANAATTGLVTPAYIATATVTGMQGVAITAAAHQVLVLFTTAIGVVGGGMLGDWWYHGQ